MEIEERIRAELATLEAQAQLRRLEPVRGISLVSVVYLLPPYVITSSQLNFAYDTIQDSLALLSGLEEGTRAKKFTAGTVS